MVFLRVDHPPQAVHGWALLPDASIYKDIFPVQGRSATLTKGGATAKIANHSPPVQHSSLIHVPMLMNSV